MASFFRDLSSARIAKTTPAMLRAKLVQSRICFPRESGLEAEFAAGCSVWFAAAEVGGGGDAARGGGDAACGGGDAACGGGAGLEAMEFSAGCLVGFAAAGPGGGGDAGCAVPEGAGKSNNARTAAPTKILSFLFIFRRLPRNALQADGDLCIQLSGQEHCTRPTVGGPACLSGALFLDGEVNRLPIPVPPENVGWSHFRAPLHLTEDMPLPMHR